ncbi:TPA: Csu type fimbrial protein [Pluralibacter gergoviae]
MFQNKTIMALSAAGLLFVSAAHAADDGSKTRASDSANMHVTLTVQAACKLSVDDMDFGTHGSNDGELNEDANATITCTKDVPYTLYVDAKHDYTMKSDAGDTVAYTLYSDSGRSKQLDDTNGLDGTGSGADQIVPIYGRVTAGALEAAPEGTYNDDVTLIVRY